MPDWIREIEDRMKSADNSCAVIQLIYHSLDKSIEQDLKTYELADIEIPDDFKFRKKLTEKFENLRKLCEEWEEQKQARIEEEAQLLKETTWKKPLRKYESQKCNKNPCNLEIKGKRKELE